MCDNKKCWKVIKPLLLYKIILNEKIAIVKGDKNIRSEKKTAKVLNEFFSNVVTNLNQIYQTSENISHLVIKAIVKCRAHPNVIAIKGNCIS